MVHMHRDPKCEQLSVMVKEEECEGGHARREERERRELFVPATFEKRQRSTSLVMVLLIESGFAEEPRAALGGAGGKGHGLQHCIENNKNNSQDKTRQTQHE